MEDKVPDKENAPKLHSSEQAFGLAFALIKQDLASNIRELVERRHIYQKVVLDYGKIVDSVRANTTTEYLPEFERKLNSIPDTLLMSTGELYAVDRSGQIEYQFLILISNMKVYCKTCKRREPHKPIWWTDAANEIAKLNIREPITNPQVLRGFQLWLIALQCQGCLDTPQAVLIRRSGWTFTLDGRAPMEHLELPSFIPKQESKWYRDAVIAQNSNKLLAATLYLRTTIEQFARRQTGIYGRATGDEIMAAYNDVLPEPQRSMMPSLREIYGTLSEAIHLAREDAVVVNEAKVGIEKHFDIRRAHRIEETRNKEMPPSI